jgi:hypothetical protein
MKRIHSWTISTLVAVTSICTVPAQSNTSFQVAKVFVTLETSVDTLTSVRDDRFTLVTINDVAVNGKVLIPKGSKIVGHVGAVTSRGKNSSKSVLGLVIDKAVTENGDVPLEAIIGAVATSKKPESESTATNASNRLKTRPAAKSGDIILLLDENAQGAVGFEDLTISWHLSIPPPMTILATRGKRLRIEAGSQMLLRMLPPKATN